MAMKVVFFCVFLSLMVENTHTLNVDVCKKYECPSYILEEKRVNYEIRNYRPYKLGTVYSKGRTYQEARAANYWKLFHFQQGNNNLGRSFDMVYPIINEIQMETWKSERGRVKDEPIADEFYMSLFIPASMYHNPPNGTDTHRIHVQAIPETTVYVVSFTGYASKEKVLQYQEKLYQDLLDDGVTFNEKRFFIAEYDPIMQPKRYNEVFYVKNVVVY